MNKSITTLSLVVSSVIHLLCCGIPLLMNVLGGSMAFWLIFQPFTPIIILFQGGILGWGFHRAYASTKENRQQHKIEKITIWCIFGITLLSLTLSHSSFFKSEEEKLKQHQVELFFKKHQK
jgi:hypothetical protein